MARQLVVTIHQSKERAALAQVELDVRHALAELDAAELATAVLEQPRLAELVERNRKLGRDALAHDVAFRDAYAFQLGVARARGRGGGAAQRQRLGCAGHFEPDPQRRAIQAGLLVRDAVGRAQRRSQIERAEQLVHAGNVGALRPGFDDPEVVGVGAVVGLEHQLYAA